MLTGTRFPRSSIWLVLAAFQIDSAHAQDSTRTHTVRTTFVNDEWERYARVLQVSGDVPRYPWSVRGFGLSELQRLAATDSAHPWFDAGGDRWRTIGRSSVTVLPAQIQAIFNSAFPYGYNDGPVWAGRGATTVLQTGVAAKAGRVSLILAPVFFRAENSAFALMPNGRPEPLHFGEGIVDGGIDQPQRFGPKAYQRLDPGNSSIRLDVGPAAVGLSTANDHWGPARDHPIILGNNASGFPRVFLGTSHPVDVWLGRVQTRAFWGKLYSSQYTHMREIQPDRFGTGLAASFVPRGAPGLEIGAGRFFHVLWSADAISVENLRLPFFGTFLVATGSQPTNQLASAFARWVFPEGGFEVYGEFGREDHSANWRDLELEPDHNSAYMVGFQRVLGKSAEGRTVIRGEVLNTRMSGLGIIRVQSRFYTHGPVGQGHTSLGEVLGSYGAFGGGAAKLAVDAYSAHGRRTVSWSRIMRGENRSAATLLSNPQQADVMHSLSVDALRFRGRMAISYELTAVYELNRHFSGNAFNIRAASGLQYAW